jgi:hypothetical protein
MYYNSSQNLKFKNFFYQNDIRFFNSDTWVFLLAAFPPFPAFFPLFTLAQVQKSKV